MELIEVEILESISGVFLKTTNMVITQSMFTKLSEKYKHEIGLTFEVSHVPETHMGMSMIRKRKKVSIETSNRQDYFIFHKSNPETIKKVAEALLDIGSFVEKLK